jgi:hypothetical protein
LPDFASHHERLGFQSCVRVPVLVSCREYSFSPIACRNVAGHVDDCPAAVSSAVREAMALRSHRSSSMQACPTRVGSVKRRRRAGGMIAARPADAADSTSGQPSSASGAATAAADRGSCAAMAAASLLMSWRMLYAETRWTVCNDSSRRRSACRCRKGRVSAAAADAYVETEEDSGVGGAVVSCR